MNTSIRDLEVIGVSMMLKTARLAASSGKAGVCEEQASLSSRPVGTAGMAPGEDQSPQLVEFVNSLLVVADTLLDTLAGVDDGGVVAAAEGLADLVERAAR